MNRLPNRSEAKLFGFDSNSPIPDWYLSCEHANSLITEGNAEEAERLLHSANLKEKRHWYPPYLYARFLTRRGSGEHAHKMAKLAFERAGTRVDVCLLYIHTLLDRGLVDEVLTLISRIDKKQRRSKELLLALASAHRSKRDISSALKALDELESFLPNDPVAARVRADTVADQDSHEGVRLYEKAEALQRKTRGKVDAATKWNSSLHYLRTRNFKKGWEYWEAGFDANVGTMGRMLPEQLKSVARADINPGSSVPDAWTLVVPEQGIGDQILFLTAFQEFASEHKNLILCADNRMYPILKRSFPEQLVTFPGLIEGWSDSCLNIKGYVPYGSILPRYRASVNDFSKGRAPFLIPDEARVKSYRAKLDAVAEGRRLIGISWKGGFWEQQKANKGCEIANLEPLLKNKDLLPVLLQYGDVTEELAYFKEHKHKVIHIADLDFKVQLDEWLALIAACDRIVSVSTALVHFAAAIGKPVSLIMPEKQGPWILGMDDEQHLAYESVKIYRKTKYGSMPALLDAIMGEF